MKTYEPEPDALIIASELRRTMLPRQAVPIQQQNINHALEREHEALFNYIFGPKSPDEGEAAQRRLILEREKARRLLEQLRPHLPPYDPRAFK